MHVVDERRRLVGCMTNNLHSPSYFNWSAAQKYLAIIGYCKVMIEYIANEGRG